jgi:hypothetical protein
MIKLCLSMTENYQDTTDYWIFFFRKTNFKSQLKWNKNFGDKYWL